MSDEPVREVRWERMRKVELDGAVAACPVVYLSFGLCEPHGLYNPLGLDALKAHALCVEAARVGGGVAAPPHYWHIHEDNPVGRAWLKRVVHVSPTYLTSVTNELFLRLFLYQLRACVNAGFKAVVAVTGHYGGAEYWMKWFAKGFQKHVAAVPVWALADWEAIDYRDEHESYKGSHAGVCETSQLLALCPELPRPHEAPREGIDPFAGGDLTKLPRASAELGRRIVDSQVRNLAAGARKMLAVATKDPQPFIEIERVAAAWAAVRRECPPLPFEMTDAESDAFFASRVRPHMQRARRSDGRLPSYALPDTPPEAIDGEEW